MRFREWDVNEKDRKCEEKENEWDKISAYGDKDTDIDRGNKRGYRLDRTMIGVS